MPIFVNNQEITDDQVFGEMQYHPAPSQEAARDAAAEALIVRQLLLDEARKKGHLGGDAGEDGEEKAILKLVEGEVSVPMATRSACKSYYEKNIERFRAKDHPEKFMPFEAMEPEIRDYLQNQSFRQGFRAYVMALQSAAKIVGFDFASKP